jgi:CRP-like cAMP-binding protein
MLSTIERILALKRAGMFGETPGPVLADVARLCEEVELAAGEQVFAKGEPGDSLYVVVQGRVRVQDGARILNDLEEGGVFGELALLDPEPRMASVSALEVTRLLRLEQGPFQELIRQQPEVALGVIRVITRYLRARAQDVATLDEQLSALAAR